MNHYRIIFILSILFIGFTSSGQNSFEKHEFKIQKVKTVAPKLMEPDFNPTINNLEAPHPEGNSVKSYLLRQKIASRAYYAQKKPLITEVKSIEKSTISGPEIIKVFEPKKYSSSGNPLNITAGLPSDNTMAISNEGIALLAMNSMVYARDMNLDTAIFPNYQISLKTLVQGASSSSYYDPKIIYDPLIDRFIMAVLKDYDPVNSEVIICFSSTNNPADPWYVYSLPGNPLNNNRWTDFPSLAITNDKLYFTANLIIPNEPWQIGFDGSIIWEMDKNLGFNGASSINSVLYSDIKFNNNYIRNLIPVPGKNGIAEDLFLLSDRNFAIENDTVFFLHLTGGALEINALKTDIPYGVPPNARQFDTDISDATNGLQTNDARILGAIKFEDEIQYVGNTINPETGFSAIYHGVITDIYGNPSIHGEIIGDSIKDYGYPNIAFSGNEVCDHEVIIGFNFTSFTDFPGTATVYVDNDRNYSSVKTIRSGYNYVNRLSGGYERWGDYFGLQAKYNEPGIVYSFGFIALSDKTNSGVCGVLKSPDTSKLFLDYTITPEIGLCNNTLSVTVNNGIPPYTYYWENDTSYSSNSIHSLCIGDHVNLIVQDTRGCSAEIHCQIPSASLAGGVTTFPNPITDIATTQFTMNDAGVVKAELYDEAGKLITVLLEKQAKKGLNEFVFSLEPLAKGNYTIVLTSNNSVLQKSKIIKAF